MEKSIEKIISIVLIIVLLLVMGWGFGFHFGANYVLDKNDGKCVNLSNEEENSNKDGINYDDLNNIYINTIDNALSYAGLGKIDSFLNNDYESINLLDNKDFKFYFACIYGYKLNSDKYQNEVGFENGEEYELSGGYAINISDFEKIYSKLYGEDYKFSGVPSSDYNYVSANDKIYGTMYTGYYSIYDFNFSNGVHNGNEIVTNIYNNQLDNTDNIEGSIKITYNKNNNETLNITGIYINKK